MEAYGTPTPLEIDLSKINVKMAIFTG